MVLFACTSSRPFRNNIVPFTCQHYLCKYIPADYIEGVQGILQKESFPDPQLLLVHLNYFSMKQKFKNSEHEKHRSKLTVFKE